MTQVLQQTGASEATASLFDRHYGRVRAYCLGQLRDCEEANDAAQSTFLYAFAALQRGVTPRNELPWLFTIAHNVCRTRRRSLRRRSRLESAVDLDTLSDSVGREDPSHDELDRLGSSLAELPENQRMALLLREWRGLSYTEVAERMGLTESAVEAVLFRARRSLAQKLRDRAASVVGWTLFIPGLRRIGSLTGTAKAAAATVAIGVAAGTAIQPLVHSRRTTPAPAVAQAAPTHVVGAQVAVVSAPAQKHRTAHATGHASEPAAPDRYQAPRSAPAAPAPGGGQPSAATPPGATDAEPQQTPRAEAVADPPAAAPAGPEAAASASQPGPQQKGVAQVPPPADPADVSPVTQVLPPAVQDVTSQVQDALPDVPVPGLPDPTDVQIPNLPSLANDASNAAASAASTVTTALPSVPAVPPLPTVPQPPLPQSPTEGTPLQGAP